MRSKAILILAFVLITSTAILAARPEPEELNHLARETSQRGGGGGFGAPYFGPGSGFGVPGFGSGFAGGYGSGYGGPAGGYARGGVVRPTVVCKEKGPCYGKKLTCPAKCFKSFAKGGKGYGYGGGGGGCTVDCKKKCSAYC
ncbi:PREDICTED: glycine-rich cell wall structural protein-like [Ipomoea nil]|uniref:glycine-rich cell wall structural protein-like n=1 Tax=Ipomoea nil TaxID=35883 RepID=UPI000901E93C|nr:PREDICTED: glycine-rich cell wall structural protein-like [Ipomoea nil]